MRALGVVLVTLWIYAPMVDAPFVYEDHNWTDTLGPHQGYGVIQWPSRWLTQASYRFQAVEGTAMPRPLHLGNVVLHLLTGGLVWLFARRMDLSKSAALLATAIFLWHPLNVAAVSYVSARSDLLMTACALIAVLAALTRRWWAIPIVMAACGLSGMAKELGALSIALVFWTWRPERLWLVAVPVLFVAASVVKWVEYGVRWPDPGLWWELSSANVMSLWRILGLMLVPIGLNVDPDPWVWAMPVRIAGLVTLGIGAVWVWRRGVRLERWSLGWLAIALVPRVVMPMSEPIHDQHAYLAMVAVAVLFASIQEPLCRAS